MPYGVLLCRRCADGCGLPCSSREAQAMHAPRQEVTGGHDGPRGGGSRQSAIEFGFKWLRVLDTAERSQVDQHVRQQFHAVVSLLDAFKAEQ